MTQPIILIKYGEIALKGRNRSLFESVLLDNLQFATGATRDQLYCEQARVYLHPDPDKPASFYHEAIKRVFGVVGFASTHRLPFQQSLTALADSVISVLKDNVQHSSLKFRIETRRATKNFQSHSMAVDREIGACVLAHFPQWKVDLKNPELTVFIEIRNEGIFIYLNVEEEKGPGGLPVGVSGRGLLLLSGGIDSPVAGWSMLKRGMLIDAVHFHSFPYTGEEVKNKVRDIVQELTRWKLRAMNLFIPYFTRIQETVNQKCPEAVWTIVHRRFMMRIAERIAVGPLAKPLKPYHALITGDNLGQVASQTVQNIGVVDRSTKLPVLRPLISFDKLEIVALAERIGTFEISKRPHEDCCTIFAPKNPKTKAIESEILAAESALDIESLIRESLEKMEIVRQYFHC